MNKQLEEETVNLVTYSRPQSIEMPRQELKEGRTEAEINPQSFTVINFIIRIINLHQQSYTKTQAFKINIFL